MSLRLPSQSGFVADAPQRHAIGRLEPCSAGASHRRASCHEHGAVVGHRPARRLLDVRHGIGAESRVDAAEPVVPHDDPAGIIGRRAACVGAGRSTLRPVGARARMRAATQGSRGGSATGAQGDVTRGVNPEDSVAFGSRRSRHQLCEPRAARLAPCRRLVARSRRRPGRGSRADRLFGGTRSRGASRGAAPRGRKDGVGRRRPARVDPMASPVRSASTGRSAPSSSATETAAR